MGTFRIVMPVTEMAEVIHILERQEHSCNVLATLLHATQPERTKYLYRASLLRNIATQLNDGVAGGPNDVLPGLDLNNQQVLEGFAVSIVSILAGEGYIRDGVIDEAVTVVTETLSARS